MSNKITQACMMNEPIEAEGSEKVKIKANVKLAETIHYNHYKS